jgi:C-terminal processing protease CtpA/Prc
MVYGFDEDYDLTIKNNQHEIQKMTIPGITSDEFMHNIKRRPIQNKEYFEFSIHKGKNIAILKIGTFGDLKGFCSFADSAFAEIKNNKVENLVIDVRNNGGGRSIVVDSLMNYITDKEYTQYQKIEVRISQELKERYKERYPNRYDWINSYAINDLLIPESNLTKPQNNNLHFKGNIYLLTNNTSFSAVATFAGVFKELRLGTIIGEETGGTIAYYGDFWYMKTPNTGITFYVSPKHFIQYGGTDYNRGVVPDYLVQDKDDSIMNFTYKLIEEKQRNTKIE